MMNVNTAWFRAKLEDKRLSQRQLARMVGMDASAMSLMLRGKRGMSVEEAGSVARVLGVATEEVIRQAGVNVTVHKSESNVRVAGWIDGHGQVHEGKALGPAVVAAPPNISGEDCAALRIQSGDHLDGWVVYYRPGRVVSLEVLGQMCIVELPDGRKLMRSVQRGYEPGFYTIFGWLNEARENVRLVSAAPVLWMKQ